MNAPTNNAVRIPMLFLDLDGTFADFDNGFLQRFGCWPSAVKKQEKWDKIKSVGNFFQVLKPLPGAVEFYNQIRHIKHAFLTGCPAEDCHAAALQKHAWVRANLCKETLVIPIPGSRYKPMVMQNLGDVIIDDRKDVCDLWEAAGGVAIHFKGKYDYALERLHTIYGAETFKVAAVA